MLNPSDIKEALCILGVPYSLPLQLSNLACLSQAGNLVHPVYDVKYVGRSIYSCYVQGVRKILPDPFICVGFYIFLCSVQFLYECTVQCVHSNPAVIRLLSYRVWKMF